MKLAEASGGVRVQTFIQTDRQRVRPHSLGVRVMLLSDHAEGRTGQLGRWYSALPISRRAFGVRVMGISPLGAEWKAGRETERGRIRIPPGR